MLISIESIKKPTSRKLAFYCSILISDPQQVTLNRYAGKIEF
ncbi:MAG: hypothetical protein OFPII_29140 [Osedax symbiont Rs1]|nr:MAG: hypothetical protein OFPII_29140 [Osedax symbiont Rs1]